MTATCPTYVRLGALMRFNYLRATLAGKRGALARRRVPVLSSAWANAMSAKSPDRQTRVSRLVQQEMIAEAVADMRAAMDERDDVDALLDREAADDDRRARAERVS